MLKIFTISFIIILLLPGLINADCKPFIEKKTKIIDISISSSIRKNDEKIVIIPDTDPYYGLISTSLSCWYDKPYSNGTIPLLIQDNGYLSSLQKKFIDIYLENEEKKILVLGEPLITDYKITEIIGSPPDVSIEAANHVFNNSSTILLVEYDNDKSYQLGLLACPLASYLNIPIILYDNNLEEIQKICEKLNVNNIISIGETTIEISNTNLIVLKNENEIQNIILDVIKEKFGEINYIVITNPSDVTPISIINKENSININHISNIKITILGKEINIFGENKKEYIVNIPQGIYKIRIDCNITDQKQYDDNDQIVPIIYMELFDSNGNIAAFSSSLGYSIGKTFIETLICNNPGEHILKISIYNGVKGGYFTRRGISIINTDYRINTNIIGLEKPHYPLIPNLSMIGPYLASVHGGIIIADSNFSLTTDEYNLIADGTSAGPWYNEKLHRYTNSKVNYTIDKIDDIFNLIKKKEMFDRYLNGPAWLGILADTNMIPMYYYGPSQNGIYEKGLPSDNPYSFDFNLSVGRIISYDIQDVSLLISRTIFYQDICGKPESKDDWHNKFNFIFGEGFGETGGIFHQIPYSKKLREYGFSSNVYGTFKNSRQISDLLKIYTGSNYIEYIGHGDWFWFTPSIYGLDYYSKAIDVAHAKKWIFEKPSVFLSSACLMGRTDGIPPEMNIGLTMLHAGCNCFIGATRETGSEAGLETFENHLIIDDFSIGEALRGEKRVDKEVPTYLVRTLYGDPAFNPYEPNNGFSNQGRPN